METSVALIVLGTIILFGFLGQVIFRKTDIPSTLWLLLIGFTLTQVFYIVDRSLLTNFTGVASAVAIIILLSDGGMSLRVRDIYNEARNSFSLMIFDLFLTVISITLIMMAFGFSVLHGLLLGSILVGTSSAIVIPIVTKMKDLSGPAKSILSVESIGDNVALVFVFVILEIMELQTANLNSIIVTVTNNILLGLAVGVIAGALWFPVIATVGKEDKEYFYPATLAVLFFVYIITEYLGGSGGIACFLAGLTLGNIEALYNKFKVFEKEVKLDVETMKFHALISFFVRTFFFVYLGSVVGLDNYTGILIGLVIVASLFITRNISIKFIASKFQEITKYDKQVMKVMFPRGLSAAVLALVPFSRGIPNTEIFVDIVFMVIFGTVILSTFGIFWIRYTHRQVTAKNIVENPKIKEEDPEKEMQERLRSRADVIEDNLSKNVTENSGSQEENPEIEEENLESKRQERLRTSAEKW